MRSRAVLVDPLASSGGSGFRKRKPIHLRERPHCLPAFADAEAPFFRHGEINARQRYRIVARYSNVFIRVPLYMWGHAGEQMIVRHAYVTISGLLSQLCRQHVKHVKQIASRWMSHTAAAFRRTSLPRCYVPR